jgi:hypothetical protein
MTDTDYNKEAESQQILQETVFNEKIVEHPKLGRIRLRMPTLATQRKIESAIRGKRKYLLAAEDRIEDPSSPSGYRKVRAFRSRDALMKEYIENGWWSEALEEERKKLVERQIELVAELELLGFEDDNKIMENVEAIRTELVEHFEKPGADDSPDIEEPSKEIIEAIDRLVMLDEPLDPKDEQLMLEHAVSTDVDDLLTRLKKERRLYNRYLEFVRNISRSTELETEYTNLFADSWQEQLQYSQRLAQVFYCTEKADTHEPVWPSIDAIEAEQNIDLIRWVFGELSAFWQGLSDEARERMSKYDFFSRMPVQSPRSEELPAPEESSIDGLQQESEPTSSTEASVTTDQSQTDKSSSVTGSDSTTG